MQGYSFPSLSTPIGSCKKVSPFCFLLLLNNIKISFSMHLDAYVANLVPFDASNESIA